MQVGMIPEPELSVVDALVQLSFLIQGILSRAAAEHDLSVVQIRLLGILRDREPLMAELAAFLALDKSSVSGLVDRAEKRGLVRRTAVPGDGRAVRVSMTGRGRALAETFTRRMETEVAAVTRGLGRKNEARLVALVTRTLAHVNANDTGDRLE